MKIGQIGRLILILSILNQIYGQSSNVSESNVSLVPQEIQLDQLIDINFHVNANETQDMNDKPVGFYKIKLNQKIPDEDLIILLVGRKDYIHSPSMYVSKTNQNPSYQNDEDFYCGIFGVDVCTISDEEIEANTYYYIGVYCMQDCEFKLKVHYDKQKHINVGESMLLRFDTKEEDEQEIRLILKKEQIQTSNIHTILIEANLLNPFDVEDGFELLVYDSNTTIETAENSDYLTYYIWDDGQAVKLIIDFEPTDRNYTILIVADKNSLISVTTEAFPSLRQIQTFKYIKDIVQYHSRVDYIYYVPTSFDTQNVSISIDLIPFYGNPELYVNPSTNPDTLDAFLWHDIDTDNSDNLRKNKDGIDSITLSKQLIKDNLKSDRLLYISVYGKTSASYKLVLYTSDLTWRALAFDCIETGYLEGGEKEGYNLALQSLTDSQITITLSSLKGISHLYVKKCVGETQVSRCELKDADILNRDNLRSQNKLYYSAVDQKLNRVQFKFDTKECSPDTQSQLSSCIYTVTVVAIQNSESQIHYRLSAQHPYVQQNLKENEKHQDTIEISEMKYYRFYVSPDDKQVTKVQIEVVTVSGEIFSYLSQTEEFPDNTNYSQSGVWELQTYEFTAPKAGENKTFGGFYYLGIEGKAFSTFYIQVKVYRVEGNGTENQLQEKYLSYGIQESGHLFYNHSDIYYFITEKPLEEDEESNFFLYFHSYDKTTQKQVFHNLKPQIIINFIEKSTNKSLPVKIYSVYQTSFFILYSIDTSYTQEGRYYITLKHSQQSESNTFIAYSVSVNNGDIWEVIPEYLYIDEIYAGESSHFELFVPEPSQVYFELFQCIGKIDIEASSSYQKLKSKNYDIKKQQTFSMNDHLVFYNFSESTQLYFSAISEPGTGLKFQGEEEYLVLFQLVPHIIQQGVPIPHQVHYLPNPDNSEFLQNLTLVKEGERDLIYSFAQVQKRFDASTPNPSKSLNTTKVIYVIHVTDQKDYLKFFSQCSLSAYDLKQFNLVQGTLPYYKSIHLEKEWKENDQKDVLNVSITGLPLNNQIYIQTTAYVMIKTESRNEAQPFTFLYPITTFDFSQVQITCEPGKLKLIDTNQCVDKCPIGFLPDLNASLCQICPKESTDPQCQPQIIKQTTPNKRTWGERIFSALFFMIFGGVLTFGGLAYYCYKRRYHPLIPEIEMGNQQPVESNTGEQKKQEDGYDVE